MHVVVQRDAHTAILRFGRWNGSVLGQRQVDEEVRRTVRGGGSVLLEDQYFYENQRWSRWRRRWIESRTPPPFAYENGRPVEQSTFQQGEKGKPQWFVDHTLINADRESWTYGRSFAAIKREISFPKKRWGCGVRRRRWVKVSKAIDELVGERQTSAEGTTEHGTRATPKPAQGARVRVHHQGIDPNMKLDVKAGGVHEVDLRTPQHSTLTDLEQARLHVVGTESYS
jgi:hypothetical protein